LAREYVDVQFSWK